MTRFTTTALVRFAHVDAAGIVFYPRYFEMLNGAVEDWCARGLGADFRALHDIRGIGVPTVGLEAEFHSPSRLGDMLDIALVPLHVGRSSCRLELTFSCGGETRLIARVTLVCTNLAAMRSTPWPDDIRARMTGTAPVAA